MNVDPGSNYSTFSPSPFRRPAQIDPQKHKSVTKKGSLVHWICGYVRAVTNIATYREILYNFRR